MEETIRKPVKAEKSPKHQRRGLAFRRHFTSEGTPPLEAVRWARRKSVIREPNGAVVFELDNAEVPEDWSQLATDIVVSKYFRKAGVPGTGHEVSVRQVIHRIAHTI
ncbi:MAG: hypothetical protein GWO16_03790, partial [Gammaproteobacteria bacterium]|nr:hypothetical protein [Gammaproteobacteria bacterium]NIR97007.1 hypothetical protein [Gammaproteobacteria bacterium]NIT64163.1 hypothetical protein [Gammaproteobacteria bacterium]NIV20311.1 hypothetical protein [Gammaproteobacteria bacterium]NIX10672.1 hypothetical protein [Gammaproteobacteria bacterium]